MLRPNFEAPVDTPQQIVERNMTLFIFSFGWKDDFLTDPDPYLRKLAETMIEPGDVWEYYNLTMYGLLRDGTHAYIESSGWEMLVAEGEGPDYNEGRGVYRSKERVSGDIPYVGYMTSKNWFLNEVWYLIRWMRSLYCLRSRLVDPNVVS